jgi:hypothetical protein
VQQVAGRLGAELERVARWALPAVTLATLFGLAFRSDALAWVARIGIVIYVLAEWPRLGAMARALVVFGLGLAALAFALLPQPGAVLVEALDRFAFLAAFLACLAMLRVAAEDSPLLRECGQYLIQQPPQRRYLTLASGSGLLGILLNIGALNLLGIMSLRGNTLAAAGGSMPVWQTRRRRMFVALLRGFAMVPLLSPLSITIAVVLSAMPQLRWIDLLPVAAVTAALLFALGWLLDRLGAPRHLRGLAPPRQPRSPRPLLLFCLLLAAIVGLTFLLAELMSVRLPVAVLFAAPLSAMLWLAAQRRRLGGGLGMRRAGVSMLRRADSIFPAMRAEVVILGGAGFLGLMLGRLLPLEPIAEVLLASGLGGPWLALAATAAVLLTAQIGLNPIASGTLLATLLPHPELFGTPPVLFGVALMAGWSLAAVSSPITAAVLIVGRMLGSSPYQIGYRWNGLFVLFALLLLAIWFPLAAAWLGA